MKGDLSNAAIAQVRWQCWGTVEAELAGSPWRWPWLPSWQQAAHVFFGDLGTYFHSSSCLKGRVTASPQGTSRKLRGQVGGGCGTSWALDSLC